MERKLTAILSADVKGYSRLMGEDEEATLLTLQAYREVTDSLIHQHKGRVVGTAGDSILAEFASAVAAVQCAVEIQQDLKAKNAQVPVSRRMEFRIGINVGDVLVEGEQTYGDGVNHYPYWYLYHLGLAYAATGRIEEATAAFKRVLMHNPDFLPAHMFLAAIYSGLGREVEARAEAAEVLRISPNYSLEVSRQTVLIKDEKRVDYFFDLLRKAGLK